MITCLDVLLKKIKFSSEHDSERALRIVYGDHNSSNSELLITKNEPTFHQQNISVLMKEIYKFENDLSPPLIDDMFQVCKINYNLRYFQKIANTKKTK